MEIDRVESDRPGYDEYQYNLGAIEHDPYVLMGYLTSAYQGFTYDEVESVLRQLFQEQYTLSFSEETEIRYRTETSVDPETGEETQEEVPYEWRILNVKLTVTPLENLVVSRMNADQKEICEILLQTKGNRQYVKNVFGTNWLPYVTSYYGCRVHPISGEKTITPVWTSGCRRAQRSLPGMTERSPLREMSAVMACVSLLKARHTKDIP